MTTQTPREVATEIARATLSICDPSRHALVKLIESALIARDEKWKALKEAAQSTIKSAEALCGSCMASFHPNDFDIPRLKAALAAVENLTTTKTPKQCVGTSDCSAQS